MRKVNSSTSCASKKTKTIYLKAFCVTNPSTQVILGSFINLSRGARTDCVAIEALQYWDYVIYSSPAKRDQNATAYVALKNLYRGSQCLGKNIPASQCIVGVKIRGKCENFMQNTNTWRSYTILFALLDFERQSNPDQKCQQHWLTLCQVLKKNVPFSFQKNLHGNILATHAWWENKVQYYFGLLFCALS